MLSNGLYSSLSSSPSPSTVLDFLSIPDFLSMAVPPAGQYRVTINSAMAHSLLSRNNDNRRIDRDVVARYADDMKAGRWKYNGEAIILDVDGTLLSGQHRLLACIQANASFEALIVTGVEKEAKDTIDTGKVRSMADVLSMDDESYCSQLSACLTCLRRYETKTMRSSAKISAPVLRDVLRRNPSIREHVARVGAGFPTKVKSTALTVASYLGSLVNAQATEEFMSGVKDGANLSVGNPALVLRNKLLNKGGKQSQPGAPVMYYRMFICTKAINASLAGKEIKAQYLAMHPDEVYTGVTGLAYGALLCSKHRTPAFMQ